MKRLFTISIAIGITALSHQVMAQALSFDSIDTDNNGLLSKAEVFVFTGKVSERGGRFVRGAAEGSVGDMLFATWDTDQNGSINRKEFDSRPRGAGGRLTRR